MGWSYNKVKVELKIEHCYISQIKQTKLVTQTYKIFKNIGIFYRILIMIDRSFIIEFPLLISTQIFESPLEDILLH